MIKLVGILNVTPDSFSDGGQFNSTNKALAQAAQLFSDGADIVDVGAESTRPGATTIDPNEEWARVREFFECVLSPALEGAAGRRTESSSTPSRSPQKGEKAKALRIQNFSLDTRNPATAQKFLELGGTIINDISGFQDPAMVDLAVKHQCQAWVSHFPGRTLEQVHEQKISSVNQVRDELLARAESLVEQGIDRSNIVLDPGIGFGKTPELNWQLLQFAALVPDWPVMIGHSKKRFLGEERYEKNGNVKAAQTAIAAGTAYLRVHEPGWYI